jgi:hypothetical protein
LLSVGKLHVIHQLDYSMGSRWELILLLSLSLWQVLPESILSENYYWQVPGTMAHACKSWLLGRQR